MSDESEMKVRQDELACCPDCGEQRVTPETAPMAPPRMACQSCEWVSLSGRTANDD